MPFNVSHPDVEGHSIEIDATSEVDAVRVRCSCGAVLDPEGPPSGATMRQTPAIIWAHLVDHGAPQPTPEQIVVTEAMTERLSGLFDHMFPPKD